MQKDKATWDKDGLASGANVLEPVAGKVETKRKHKPPIQTDGTNKPHVKSTRGKRNRKKFDEDNVKALPTKQHQYMCWDAGRYSQRGLGILISPTGTRSYRVVYYYPGSSKPQSMHLGRVGEMTLAKARKLAEEARTKAREGVDPKAADVTRSSDFKSSVEDYVRHYQIGEQQNVTALECRRILLKACAEWHQRPIATIRAKEIGDLLRAIRDGDGKGSKAHPYQANRVFSQLRTFFTWCALPDVEKIKISPMVGMKKPFAKEKPRDRHFNDDEIKALWRAANKIGGVEGRFVKALILTGKRKGALSRMKWEHINKDWFWEPPASESNQKKHLLPVPLSSLMQSVIDKRQSQGYVFPGPTERTHYLDDGTLRHRVRRESGVDDFFPHALRHTVETKLAELRIQPHVRDLLLDHVPQRGSGARYDHHSYGDEMREAIEKWAAYVADLVQPKLVAEKQ
jgi:integrase